MKRLMFLAAALLSLTAVASGPKPSQPTPTEILKALPPIPKDSYVDIDVTTTDGGSTKTTDAGRGSGASGIAEGDKLSENLDGSAPMVNLASKSSQGGSSSSSGKASAMKIAARPWENPFLWIGVVMIAAGAFLWLRVPLAKKTGLAVGVSGLCCVAAAIYPMIIPFAAAAGILFLLGPTIAAKMKETELHLDKTLTEDHAKGQTEGLRAILAAVFDSAIPDEVQKSIWKKVADHADAGDVDTMHAIMQSDRLGPFA